MSGIIKVDGKSRIKLRDIDPDHTDGEKKEDAIEKVQKLEEELEVLQELLYAGQETPVLMVLQGLDTSGKDGTIKHAMSHLNPQSCSVASFKVPTPLEAAHDFLWRVHQAAPQKGHLQIFNRSHYEDVLVVRVHNMVPEKTWKARYAHINNFEKLLADNNTVIIKFFLHISSDEQEARLKARENDPAKAWKLSAADWKERELWDQYQQAYEDAINKCSTASAPWYVVPANRKWYRNLVIAQTLVETLRPYRKTWERRLRDIGATELKSLRAARQTH